MRKIEIIILLSLSMFLVGCLRNYDLLHQFDKNRYYLQTTPLCKLNLSCDILSLDIKTDYDFIHDMNNDVSYDNFDIKPPKILN